MENINIENFFDEDFKEEDRKEWFLTDFGMLTKEDKMDLEKYNQKDFKQKLNFAKDGIINDLNIPKTKRVCLLFDFDDTLTNMHKLQVEDNIEINNDFDLEEFLDTYTQQVSPKKQMWEIIFNRKSFETVMILTGNKWENVLGWLLDRCLEKHINHVFSTWSYEGKNIDDTAIRKRKILEFIGSYFDEVLFFDDNEENLLLGLEVPNVRSIKVSTEYPDLEES